MIERRGKSKFVVTFTRGEGSGYTEKYDWCVSRFGIGGRNPKCNWRYGWTDKLDTFHFKNQDDALQFLLRFG